jgi:ribulose-phosphate 3-epimerase
MKKIFPSLLAANQLNLEHEIKKLEAQSNGFHVDIIDNHFAPNLGLSIDTCNRIATITHKQLYIHFMVDSPIPLLEKLTIPPAHIIAVHVERPEHLDRALELIARKKCLPSLALSPETPLSAVKPYLDRVHNLLLMSVTPGFSGQKFNPSVLKKLEQIPALQKEAKHQLTITIDGGITTETIGTLAKGGGDIFCIGSAIFQAPDSLTALEALKDMIK